MRATGGNSEKKKNTDASQINALNKEYSSNYIFPVLVNKFHATDSFYTPWKDEKNFWFSDVFRGM